MATAHDDEQPQPLVQESTARIFTDASHPTVRLVHLLLPRAAHPPALPPLPTSFDPVLLQLQVEFKGWAPESPTLWRRWVAKLRPHHEPLWQKAGILDAVLATTCRVRRDEGALLQLAAFWRPDTNTFVFPWGEATLTLQDVAVLGGLPLLGSPVRAPPQASLSADVDALEAALYLESHNGRPDRAAWANHFLERPTGKDDDRLEHSAFLAMWLSLHVFPAAPFDVVRAEVLPIAARLARGHAVALAPAALATIYSDLSALNRYINLEKRYQAFVVWAPLQIVQLWLWKRFPELRPPEMADPDGNGSIPREAHLHNALRQLDPVYVHAVFMSPNKFEWRPYGSSSFVLPPEMGSRRVHGQDIATNTQLLSFILCLRACELVGMRCIEHYRPHRVAKQLGFDQDVPGTLARVNSNWVAAWGTYRMEPEKFVFIVPKYKPALTIDYVQWWAPYLLGCATAVAKAEKMKQLPLLVTPRKRMIDVPPATTPKRVRNGAKEKDMEVLFEVPEGLVRTANELSCVSATKTGQGKSSQRGNDVAQDQENISSVHSEVVLQPQLVEDAVNTGSNEAFGAATAVDVHSEEVSLDVAAALVSMVDGLSCVSATKREQGKPSQQDKEEAQELSVTHDKERNRSSVVDVHSKPIAAVNTGSNRSFGPATVVDVQSEPEDIVVISDDDDDDEVNVGAMHQKLTQLNTAPPSLEEQNTEMQIVSASSNAQDSLVMINDMVQSNCDHETDTVRSDIFPTKEPLSLDVDTFQPDLNILQRPTEETHTCAVTGQIDKGNMVEKEKMAGLEGIRKENKDVSSSFQRVDSLVEEPLALDVDTFQPDLNILERTTNVIKTCTVTGQIDKADMVEKEKLAGLEGIKKANGDVSPAFEKVDSLVEDCMKANRRTNSGNSYSSGLAHADTQLGSRVLCTKTLYYLRRRWSKYGQDRDATGTIADEETFEPRWEVGTCQMIKEAFAARQVQNVELQKAIDCLKEEIVALKANQRTGTPQSHKYSYRVLEAQLRFAHLHDSHSGLCFLTHSLNTVGEILVGFGNFYSALIVLANGRN
uniref:Aminotransferase-like plant mobile domain-containing protein n=1 Tax=Leersia perrieri TaxID=77586 RepID=A0A0D9VVN2_9ORYZ